MVLESELAVGALQRLLVRITADSQDFVIVTHGIAERGTGRQPETITLL